MGPSVTKKKNNVEIKCVTTRFYLRANETCDWERKQWFPSVSKHERPRKLASRHTAASFATGQVWRDFFNFTGTKKRKEKNNSFAVVSKGLGKPLVMRNANHTQPFR